LYGIQKRHLQSEGKSIIKQLKIKKALSPTLSHRERGVKFPPLGRGGLGRGRKWLN